MVSTFYRERAFLFRVPCYVISRILVSRRHIQNVNGILGDEVLVYWMSWKRLCQNKERGGMSFREIASFNPTMLANQSWRILKNPNSLLFKTLWGRYFKDGNFLDAKLGNSPSITWRSICWGRELFLKGLKRRVCNRKLIDIEKDPWISRTGKLNPYVTKDNLKGLRVSILLDDNNRW